MRTKKKVPVIKERVKDMLKAKDTTQKQMAADLDITPEQLNRCLSEGMISKLWLNAIADYLDCSPEWLSSESAPALSSFGHRRGTALTEQGDIIKAMFLLLGYSENRYDELSKADIENLKTDIDMLLAYYLQKARNQK